MPAAGRAQTSGKTLFDDHATAVASAQLERQQLVQLLKDGLPDHDQAKAEKAADEFAERLRVVAPIAAENLKQGRMDEDELHSRVAVFLREHPEYTGLSIPMSKSASPRERVAELLHRFPQAGASDGERLAAADKFIARLQEKSRAASESLNSGRMTDDEVQSRLEVYFSDLRGDSSTAAVDPKTAAVTATVEAYLKANYGVPTERAFSFALRGTVHAEAGGDREFSIFRKRPGKLRMHILKDGLVIGVIGYDGRTAWRQEPGQPARELTGPDAEPVTRTSRFDDPLADYAERGAALSLVDKSAENLLQLRLVEKDGTEAVFDLDPKTFRETAQRTREPGGEWVEIRFSDHRKAGALVIARAQEEWRGGKLVSTTRITDVATDPGLLDQFFSPPGQALVGYMDYMAGLATIKERQEQKPPLLPAKKETAK